MITFGIYLDLILDCNLILKLWFSDAQIYFSLIFNGMLISILIQLCARFYLPNDFVTWFCDAYYPGIFCQFKAFNYKFLLKIDLAFCSIGCSFSLSNYILVLKIYFMPLCDLCASDSKYVSCRNRSARQACLVDWLWFV